MKIIKGWAIVNVKGDDLFFYAKIKGRRLKGFSVMKTELAAKYWLEKINKNNEYRIQKVKVEEEK